MTADAPTTDAPTTGRRDVIAVGASAGGVEALRSLVAGLPPDYPAVVLVVLHVPRDTPSALAGILSRSGPLPATTATDGEPLGQGRILVAPNNRHLLVVDGHVALSHGPAENGHRPAVDPLFRSVARAYGPRAVGVVLSGARDDGADGLATIAGHGGMTVVQDPNDAVYPSMPRAALERVTPDHVAPAAKLGGLLAAITALDLTAPALTGPHTTGPHITGPGFAGHAGAGADARLDAEVAIAGFEPVTAEELAAPPSGYGCPACGGALFDVGSPRAPRYRCRIGHAWSQQALLDEQGLALEGALWMALRALEEKSSLSRRMAAARPGGHAATAARFRHIADDADAAGAAIRELIQRLDRSTAGAPSDGRPDGPAHGMR